MGKRDLEDIAILVGLGVVGVFAAQKFFPNKSPEEILEELTTSLTSFLDTIKLPALPAIPTISYPPQQAAAQPTTAPAAQIPQAESLPAASTTKKPSSKSKTEPTSPTAKSTNTMNGSGETEPKVNDPPVKPKGSGQLASNPTVPPPPSGSGGAIIAFAGDWESGSKAVATAASIDKTGCNYIVGVGDYSYSGEKAAAWFTKVLNPKWKGKMSGCYGNHDTHDSGGFLSLFGMSNWNQAVKVAPNLAVVYINTQGGINAAQLDTITTQAKGMGAKHIAYVLHKPYITSGNAHHGPGENKWSSIIDAGAKKHGVKLVVAGHNHLYEHFMCGGIHYVTSGAAGRKFYGGNCQGSCGPVKCVENTNGFLKVSVGNSLLCQFISNKGETLDSFTIS